VPAAAFKFGSGTKGSHTIIGRVHAMDGALAQFLQGS
jgi:hypothetical protein